ncbi:LADA_0F11738g1_1 [Lachancea dasiensis]|uniref:Pre-rRNA-processing protein n=1 Tax=Lachancea dasiensis TaxID=1072105 RepID=A0A1G4JML0_9SACH|nr:LADA_0F11738g1_1 [Lachancea dasiensis]
MAKKKTLKQQDFQKKKLKVGKPKQAASNATDTSFTARMISLPNQPKIKTPGLSNNTSDNGSQRMEADILKRLSLCKHHSATTRKETLVYFKQAVPKIINTKCITPMLNSCLPLICDDDAQVRNALLELFDEIGQHDQNVLRLHSRALVLFINSGMTHIVPAVQRDSGKFLKCAVRYCGDELVRNSWVKMLKGLFGVLGWAVDVSRTNNSVSMGVKSASVVSMNSAKAKRAQKVNLETLLDFVQCGCIEPTPDATLESQQAPSAFDKYIIPNVPQPFQHLKLFVKELKNEKAGKGSKLDELANVSLQDYPARREVLVEHFLEPMLQNTSSLIADGGDSGKVANSLQDTLHTIKQLHES